MIINPFKQFKNKTFVKYAFQIKKKLFRQSSQFSIDCYLELSIPHAFELLVDPPNALLQLLPVRDPTV